MIATFQIAYLMLIGFALILVYVVYFLGIKKR